MTSEPLALARWLDVGLVLATVPVLLLAGLPALGVVAGGGVYLLQRVIGAVLERRAKASGSARTEAGLILAGMLGRAWMLALGILAVLQVGEREDALAAALLVLAAYTVYFVLSLVIRPMERSSTHP